MEEEEFVITPERIAAVMKSHPKRTWRCGTPEVLAAERKMREEVETVNYINNERESNNNPKGDG